MVEKKVGKRSKYNKSFEGKPIKNRQKFQIQMTTAENCIIIDLDQCCIVCNARAFENPGREFYPFIPLPKKTYNTEPVVVSTHEPKYICSLHFKPKGSTPGGMQCFVCGALKRDFPDREFTPLNAKSKDLIMSGIPITITTLSANSAFICSIHFNKEDTIEIDCDLGSTTKEATTISSDVCCIPTCNIRNPSESRYKFFPVVTTKWWKALKAVNVPIVPRSVICRRHFEQRFFTDDDRLTLDAVPTLYLESSTEKYGSLMNCEVPEIQEEPEIIDLDSDSESEYRAEMGEQELDVVMETSIDSEYEEGNRESEDPVGTPLLGSVENVVKYMQPLFDMALFIENYEAVDLLSRLEDIFKREIRK